MALAYEGVSEAEGGRSDQGGARGSGASARRAEARAGGRAAGGSRGSVAHRERRTHCRALSPACRGAGLPGFQPRRSRGLTNGYNHTQGRGRGFSASPGPTRRARDALVDRRLLARPLRRRSGGRAPSRSARAGDACRPPELRTVDTTTIHSSPPKWLVELTATQARPERALADLAPNYPLPEGFASVNVPIITGAFAGYQTRNSAVPSSAALLDAVASSNVCQSFRAARRADPDGRAGWPR